MYYVIETAAGKVCGLMAYTTYELAMEHAKKLCRENGILFEGTVSCDGNVRQYSVQIYKV